MSKIVTASNGLLGDLEKDTEKEPTKRRQAVWVQPVCQRSLSSQLGVQIVIIQIQITSIMRSIWAMVVYELFFFFVTCTSIAPIITDFKCAVRQFPMLKNAKECCNNIGL